MSFKELDFSLVLLGGFKRVEGPQIPSFTGLGVDGAGVEAVASGGQLADHEYLAFSSK